jgi:peroxiredoxin
VRRLRFHTQRFTNSDTDDAKEAGMWLASLIALWAVILLLGFLLLGVLRAMAHFTWRLQQLEATTPHRMGRSGLKLGSKARDFTCFGPNGQRDLHEWFGGKILLVFLQIHCKPCEHIVPELNRLQHSGELQVVTVLSDTLEMVQKWAAEVSATFLTLTQQNLEVSRRYEVFATPFAFLIDEQGTIVSKGFVTSPQHIQFVLAAARKGCASAPADTAVEQS